MGDAGPPPADRWPGGVRGTGRAALAALALGRRTSPGHCLAYALVMLFGAVVPLCLAWLTRAAIDAVVAGRVSALLPLGLALAGAGAATGLVPHAARYLRQELERRVAVRAQDELFAATEKFVGLARFEDPAFQDRLRLAVDSGGRAPVQTLATALGAARTVIVSVGFAGSLFVVGPWMAIVLLASAVPAVVAEFRLARGRAAMLWRIGPVERRELFYRQLLTGVQAATELRLFGLVRHFRARMSAHRGLANRERARLDRRELAAQLGLGALAAAVAGGGLVWALRAAGEGRLTVGDVSLFTAAVAGVQSAAAQLVGELAQANAQVLLFTHYLAVRASPPDLPVAVTPRTAEPLRRGIEFRDVWFRYGPGLPWVLRGACFTIPYGRAVGLVGRNGAGKSTVVKLLCRMYDPERGAVLWDGVDLRDLDPVRLRDRIGVVCQEYMRYDLTVAENVGLGDLAFLDDRERIAAAAGRAGIHQVVAALPQGYDTMLSRVFFGPATPGVTLASVRPAGVTPAGGLPVGVTLSGGQWQRVALARGLLRHRRDLLILDEPSSGLDAEAEHDIHTMLRDLRSGATSLLISHRLSALRGADRIVVLDGGRIAEQGTHDELLADGQLYAQLYRTQASGYREAEPV